MICPDCGMQNPDNANYCDCCGCKLTPSSSPANASPSSPAPPPAPSAPVVSEPAAAQTPLSPEVAAPAAEEPATFRAAAPVPPPPPSPSEYEYAETKSTRSRSGIIIASIIGGAIVIGAVILALGLINRDKSNDDDINIPEIEEVAETEIPAGEITDERPDYQSFDWLIDNVCRIQLEPSDFLGLSSDELRLLRNSVYARHGRRFKDPALQNYFNSLPWYSPTRDEVSVYELSETERHNVSVIQSME